MSLRFSPSNALLHSRSGRGKTPLVASLPLWMLPFLSCIPVAGLLRKQWSRSGAEGKCALQKSEELFYLLLVDHLGLML